MDRGVRFPTVMNGNQWTELLPWIQEVKPNRLGQPLVNRTVDMDSEFGAKLLGTELLPWIQEVEPNCLGQPPVDLTVAGVFTVTDTLTMDTTIQGYLC